MQSGFHFFISASAAAPSTASRSGKESDFLVRTHSECNKTSLPFCFSKTATPSRSYPGSKASTRILSGVGVDFIDVIVFLERVGKLGHFLGVFVAQYNRHACLKLGLGIFMDRPTSRAGVCKRAAVEREQVLEFLHGAVAVVGVSLDNQSTAAVTICFISYLLKFGSVAGGFAQGSLDVVQRHVGGARLLYRCAYTRSIFVSFCFLYLYGNKSDEFRKKFCLLSIGLALNVFELRPLAVSCH